MIFWSKYQYISISNNRKTTIIFGTITDYILLINTLASNNATETFSKMASTLSQIWLMFFCQKAQNFVHFLPYDFVQISPACGPNTYQIMYGEIVDFRCQRQ